MSENSSKQDNKKPNNNRRRRRFSKHQKNKPKNVESHRPQQKKQKNSKWNKFRVSDHFLKRDFDSRKKDCSCDSSLRISLGLVGIIEALRAKLNKRIDIITGYYCPECRKKQYGIKRDFHNMGVAADIRVADMDPVELFLIAETFPEIKGLGINFDDGHVHIDTRKEDERESWVEKDNEWIRLTDDNRTNYIPVAVVDEPESTD